MRCGEETVTDLNLLEFRSRGGTHVITHSFTKPAEGSAGADWEWWFRGSKGGWCGLRVQAKVIDVARGRFEHLHYRNKSGQWQGDLLIQDALSQAVPMFPVYALYTHWVNAPTAVAPCWPYWWGGPEVYGCSIVSADQVRRLRNVGNSLEDLAPTMYPWHCLVCCGRGGANDLAEAVLAFVQDRTAEWRAVDDPTVDGAPEEALLESLALAAVPPRYITDLLEGLPPDGMDERLSRVDVWLEGESTNF